MSRRIVHILLIVVVGLLAYSNTLHVPFQFDDDANITDNHIIKNFEYFLNPSEAEGARIYHEFRSRYIGFLTFALNYQINGLDVTGYHLVNLAIHIVNGLLVYWLVLLTFQTPYFSGIPEFGESPQKKGQARTLAALFSALFFISHPIQTQAVTYIVQRLASLATLFYLLSLTLYVAWRLAQQGSSDKKKHRSKALLYPAALTSAILAMKTKEIAVTLPAIILLYEFLLFEGKIRKRILHLIPFLLTVLIIPLTWAAIDSGQATQSYVSRPDYLFTQFRVIITYIRLLLFPVNQNLDYDYPISHSFIEPGVFLSFLFLLSLFGLALYLLYRSQRTPSVSRLTAFGILWFFITLSAESSVIPIADVIFEHRVYLPSVGFFIAITSLFLYRSSYHTPRLLLLLSAIVLIWLFVSYSRNEIWFTRTSLWSDAAQKSPGKARPHNNLGNCYLIEGRYMEAVLEYKKAQEADPAYLEVYGNLFALGSDFEKRGGLREAVFAYDIVCRSAPELFHDQKTAACERVGSLGRTK